MSAIGATIVLTFVVVALFMREARPRELPRFEIPIGAALRLLATLLRVVAVALFLLTLCAGFFGAQDPYRNLITTMVWIVWWVGLAFICALVGNLWALVNPLATLFAWEAAPRIDYPSWLGAWPAVALFFAFAWAELVWQANDVPAYLARAVLVYALITWAAMFIFGRSRWLENGEAFSLAFGLLGRFAPLEVAHGRLVVRIPGAGLAGAHPVRFSFLVFVLLMLASVTFDGFLETPLNQRIETAVQESPALARLLFRLSEWGLPETQVVATLGLAAFALAFLAAFWLTGWIMKVSAATTRSATEVACSFVLTLVPIAVAYHLAHYFSLLLTAGQFIIPLASDPFGFGWDLFGTAGYKVDLGLVSPYVFWYGAVTLVVAGHVIAVVLAHAAALRVFGSRRAALASQVPMLALMVAYTMLSLWSLAQPVVG